MIYLNFILWFGLVMTVCAQFEVPEATVEVYSPRGLKVSIPDEEGIQLFAFHGKVNEEFNAKEGGTFSKDVLKAKDGRWTFYDPIAKLKIGDILYYWTYVDYGTTTTNKLGYERLDEKFVVTKLLSKDTNQPVPTVPTVTPTKKPPKTTTESSGSCEHSATTFNGHSVCAGKEIFTEQFGTFRPKFWTREVQFAGEPDFEFVIYTNKPENLNVQKNLLKIVPIPTDELYGKGLVTSSAGFGFGENCTGIPETRECFQQSVAYLILPPVTSARITTKGKWSFKFGKIEIRAKLPKGDWIYPELFLNPATEEYGPGYESGQIRVAFLAGNSNHDHTLYGGCILGSKTAAKNYAMRNIKSIANSWSDDFHKFSVVWKPDQITLSVDDKTYGNIYPPAGGFAAEASNLELPNAGKLERGSILAPFDKEMYITIGVGVGGHCFEDREDGSKPWVNNDPKSQKNFYKAQTQWKQSWGSSSQLEVDYVKIWAL